MGNSKQATAKVGLDYSAFEKGAKAVEEAANRMAGAVKAALVIAGGAVLAAFGVKTISAALNSANAVIELGEQTANAGKKAGLAAGQWYLFNRAIEKGVGLKTMGMLIGENASVLDRSANVFRDVAIKLWVVGEKIRGFWLGLMDRLAPVLSKLLDGALAQNLVSAGQAFGDAISNALKVIYQLAADGALWEAFKLGFKIAFDYAGQRMIWLAGFGFDLLKEAVTLAFSEGLIAAWNGVKTFVYNFGVLLGDTIAKTFETKGNNGSKNAAYVAGGVGAAALATGGLSLIPSIVGAVAGSFLQDLLEGETESLREKGQAPTNEESGFAKRFAEISERNLFKPSQGLTNEVAKFSETVTAALAKFDKNTGDEPAQAFENNTRRAAFGADSFAAIGAGGNVSMGLNVLGVQQKQLTQLEEINQILRATRYGSSGKANAPDSPPGGVSRWQSDSVVDDGD